MTTCPVSTTRRFGGEPSVHAAFGERLAVLPGDALIVLGFEWLALEDGACGRTLGILAHCVGGPSGICAGQAWECEQTIDIVRYQRAKTGALFAACTMGGAASQGYEAFGWQKLGFAIGEAFQVADDLRDVAGSAEKLGKPVHQDEANHTPNFVAELGFDGAMAHFEELLKAARDAIPDCPGRDALAKQIEGVDQPCHRPLGAHRRRVDEPAGTCLRPVAAFPQRSARLPPLPEICR